MITKTRIPCNYVHHNDVLLAESTCVALTTSRPNNLLPEFADQPPRNTDQRDHLTSDQRDNPPSDERDNPPSDERDNPPSDERDNPPSDERDNPPSDERDNPPPEQLGKSSKEEDIKREKDQRQADIAGSPSEMMQRDFWPSKTKKNRKKQRPRKTDMGPQQSGDGKGYSNEYRIKRRLLLHYDKTTRPVRNDSSTTLLYVGMSLYHILDTVSTYYMVDVPVAQVHCKHSFRIQNRIVSEEDIYSQKERQFLSYVAGQADRQTE